MTSDIQSSMPVPYGTSEDEGQEDWSDIWALEDPAISGAQPEEPDLGERAARDQ